MKRIFFIIFLILLLPASWAGAAATTYYVTQNGSGTPDGKSYANSWSMASFNDNANWSATDDANKIDSDDTVYICDAITTALDPRAGSFTSGELTIRGDLAEHAGIVTVSSGHALKIYWDSYVTFRNLTFKNTGAGNVIYIDPDTSDGSDRTNIKIHDCIIQSGNAEAATLTYGIKFRGGQGTKNVKNFWIYNNTIEHMYKGLVDDETYNEARPSDGISIYITQSGKDHGPFYIYHNHVKGFFHGSVVVTAYETTYTSLDEIYIWENEFDGEDSHAESYMRGISVCAENSFIFRNYLHDLTVRNQNYYGNIHFYNNVNANSIAYESDSGGGGYVGGAGTFDAHSNHRIYNNTYYALDESAIYLCWNGAGSLDLVDIRNNVFHDCGSGNSGNRAVPGTTPRYAWETISFVNDAADGSYIDSIVINNNLFYPVTGSRTEDILLYDKISRGFSASLLTVSELNSEAFAEVSAANNLGPATDPSMSDPANEVYKYDAGSDPGVDAGETLTGPSIIGLNPPSGVVMGYDDGIHPNTDFTDFIATVKSLKHSDYGTGWELGAIVYKQQGIIIIN